MNSTCSGVGALLLAMLAQGCGPESGPKVVRLFGRAPEDGAYRFFDARLDSLEDATELKGGAAQMRAGATLVVDATKTDPKDVGALRLEGGSPASARFAEENGVLVPEDYDTLVMASAYWSLERAKEYFVQLGEDPEKLGSTKAYYTPRVQVATKVMPTFWVMVDNAAYATPVDSFLLVPHLFLTEVPLSVNLGVMTHEYGHRVFNQLVEQGNRLPISLQNDWPSADSNALSGVNEGLSDVFGAGLTGDSNYIAPSIPAGLADRDLASLRIITREQVDLALGKEVKDARGKQLSYDPHELGAYVASALWHLGDRLKDPGRVSRVTLEAERSLGEALAASPASGMSVSRFFNHFLARLSPAERSLLCPLLTERLGALFAADVLAGTSGPRFPLECP